MAWHAFCFLFLQTVFHLQCDPSTNHFDCASRTFSKVWIICPWSEIDKSFLVGFRGRALTCTLTAVSAIWYSYWLLIFFSTGQGSFSISGKVESGSVQNNDRIVVMPAGENGAIKGENCFFVCFKSLFPEPTGSVIGIALVTWMGGCEFKLQPSHTKDWQSIYSTEFESDRNKP